MSLPAGPAVEWTSSVEASEWWTAALADPRREWTVGTMMLPPFEAMARVFHPLCDGERWIRWSEIAAANGRVAHAEMQFAAISTPADEPVHPRPTDEPWCGELPDHLRPSLVEILSGDTGVRLDCWFGVWDGYGHLHGDGGRNHVVRGESRFGWVRSIAEQVTKRRMNSGMEREPLVSPSVVRGPKARIPSREFFLARGSLWRLEDFCAVLGQSPNVWWPADQRWFVHTDIDHAWTYVGGSRSLVDSILASDLEAFEALPGHRFTIDADTINR